MLPPESPSLAQLADGSGWLFDFALDVQTFHCLRKVDEQRAAQAYAALLRSGGTLLMLTGNADEPAERGPERLKRWCWLLRGRDAPATTSCQSPCRK